MTDQPISSLSADPNRTHLVFGILLSGFMALFFAGFFPLLALGFTKEWLMTWASGIVIGWPLGFVIVSLIERPLMRLAKRLTRRWHL